MSIPAHQASPSLRGLFDVGQPLAIRCFAVLDDAIRGQIWTDDLAQPSWDAVQEAAFGTLFLGGRPEASLVHQLVAEQRQERDVALALWPDHPYNQLLPPEPDFDGWELEFTDRPLGADPVPDLSVPDGCALRANYAPMLSEQDELIFDVLIPADHYLRQANALVDFEQYRAVMAACYHASDGRPANDPVVLLKICFLQTHYNLSDREVLAAAQVNVAFRYFLNLALTDTLPHSSLLTVLRARLGASLYQQIFDGVVAQARAAGLVKDRLRLGVTTFFQGESPLSPKTLFCSF